MELLQQVRLLDPHQAKDCLADVLIIDGKIKAIAERTEGIDAQIKDYPSQVEVISGQDFILAPGLVDLYSYSGEPGNESRETLLALAQAAASGGFTQVGILPDTNPRLENDSVIAALRQKSSDLSSNQPNLCLPKLCFWGGVAPDNNSKQMNELGELKAGVIGFSDRFNLASLNFFRQVLEYIQPWSKTLAIALDANELAGDGVVREGKASLCYGMLGNPSFSEAAIVAAVLEIIAEIPTHVHIMRISTKRGVELIAEAKARGLSITASTTWMHLLWNSEAVGSYDPNLRLEPPLGSPEDQAALITGVKQGVIEAVAIDHHAYTYEEKTVPFGLAPPGVIGLQLALPLLWQGLVKTGKLSALELWQALSSRPRQCLQQQPTVIASEQTANLILFDPNKTWLAEQNNLNSLAINTPYYNQQIIGKVVKSWN